MAARFLAVFAFACLYGILAFANGGGGQCANVTDLAPWLRIQTVMGNAPLIPMSITEGEEAKRIVALFNAEPPASRVVADTVVVFARKDAPYVLMFLVRTDCVVDAGQIRIDLWDRWQGEPS